MPLPTSNKTIYHVYEQTIGRSDQPVLEATEIFTVFAFLKSRNSSYRVETYELTDVISGLDAYEYFQDIVKDLLNREDN